MLNEDLQSKRRPFSGQIKPIFFPKIGNMLILVALLMKHIDEDFLNSEKVWDQVLKLDHQTQILILD